MPDPLLSYLCSNERVSAVVVSRIMNVFRLVLFLAGLAAYLLAKQFLPSTEVSKPSPALGASPLATPQPQAEVAPASAPTPAVVVHIENMKVVPVGIIGLKQSTE